MAIITKLHGVASKKTVCVMFFLSLAERNLADVASVLGTDLLLSTEINNTQTCDLVSGSPDTLHTSIRAVS